MEEDEVNSAHGDAAVGEIKHRLEEAQGRAADPGQPGGPGGIDKREIEHVHHFPEHQGRVTPAKGSQGIGTRSGKKLAVEQTVQDVAQRAGRDEGKPHQDAGGNRLGGFIAFGRTTAGQLSNPPAEEAEEADPEERQEEFPYCAAEFHAESHPLVLNKEDAEPVSDNMETSADGQIYLDQDLDDLVYHYEQDAQQEQLLPLADFHHLPPVLANISFASTVRVA